MINILEYSFADLQRCSFTSLNDFCKVTFFIVLRTFSYFLHSNSIQFLLLYSSVQ